MLVVNVELWPGGDVTRRRQICEMQLGNISQLNELSDYTGSLFDPDLKAYKEVKVIAHKRSDGAWVLIKKALEAIGY